MKFAVLNGEFKNLYHKDLVDTDNYKIIYTKPIKSLNSPLSYHVDIQLAKIDDNTFVCEPTTYEYYSDCFKEFNVKLICGTTMLKSNYPEDIAYNVARVGNKLFCCEKHTDKSILDNFDGIVVNIKQGYSKCNMCIVGDKGVITSDVGIYSTCVKHGIDVLKIEKGNINLFPYEYGFIGGAAYNTDKNNVSFFGNLKKHPDYLSVINFCRKHNCGICFDEGYDLCDLGSAVFSS